MWLFKHKRSKFWKAGWQDPRTGRDVSKSTKTTDRKLAKQRGEQYEREHDSAPTRLPTQTLDEAVLALIAHKRRRRSAATIEATECKCGHLLRLLGRTTLLDDINRPMLLEYLDKRTKEGAHKHTVKKEHGNLLQALRVARSNNEPPLYNGDITRLALKEEFEGAYKPRTRCWTMEDYRTAMAHMIVSRMHHVTIYCHTGVRFGELYKLEARHVDEVNRRIWVDGSKSASTEQDASKRWVPLDEEAWAVIKVRMKRYPTGLLFPDHWDKGRLNNDMRRVAKRAGVPVVSTNDFRRTFATWCGEAEVDESVCERWMGHTNNKMIRSVYKQLSDRRAAAQGRKLSTFTGASNGTSDHSTQTVHSGLPSAPKTQ